MGRTATAGVRTESRADVERSGRARHVLAALLLLVVTLTIYVGDLGLGWFGVDDASYVTDNALVQSSKLENLRAIFAAPYAGNYSPIHLLSYVVDGSIAGIDAAFFHLSNNLWAWACSLGVYAVAWRLLGSAGRALVAALLFAVHPTHVEAVAWISSRKDLLSTAFALFSYTCWMRQRVSARPAVWYASALVLFALAVGSKLSVVVLPAVFLLHDVLVERRRGIGVLVDKLPFVALVAVVSVIVLQAQPDTNVEHGLGEYSQILAGLLFQLSGFGSAAIFRPIPDASLTTVHVALLSVVAWGSLIAAFALARRRPLPTLLVAWICLGLVPAQVLSFVYPVSDRYLFFSTAPLAILLVQCAWIGMQALGQPRARALAVALVLLGGFWAAKTLRTLGEWRDARSVWYAASQRVSDINVHEYLGAHYLDAVDRLAGARAQGEPLPEGSADLARALGADEGQLEILQREWQEQRAHRPLTDLVTRDWLALAWEQFEQAFAIPTERALPTLHYRRGRLLDLRGDLTPAFEEFRQARADAERYPIEVVSQLYQVQASYAMALVAERLGDGVLALQLARRARADQQRFGADFLDLDAEVTRFELALEAPNR